MSEVGGVPYGALQLWYMQVFQDFTTPDNNNFSIHALLSNWYPLYEPHITVEVFIECYASNLSLPMTYFLSCMYFKSVACYHGSQ